MIDIEMPDELDCEVSSELEQSELEYDFRQTARFELERMDAGGRTVVERIVHRYFYSFENGLGDFDITRRNIEFELFDKGREVESLKLKLRGMVSDIHGIRDVLSAGPDGADGSAGGNDGAGLKERVGEYEKSKRALYDAVYTVELDKRILELFRKADLAE